MIINKKNKGAIKLEWIIVIIILFILGYLGVRAQKINIGKPNSVSTPPPPPAAVLNLQDAFVSVAEHVKPAVVNISIYKDITLQQSPYYEFFFGSPFDEFFEEYFNSPRNRRSVPQQKKYQRKRMYEGMGSGVIIDEEGYILTNEHVVHDADEIKVTLPEEENKPYTGKVIGKDERTDLAVVKINKRTKIPVAKLGDSSKIRVGDWVIAIGSPFGLEQTVTVGIISAKRQSLSIENKEYKDLLQTDAAINQGNSGGPLINIHGEIIGINTAIYAPTGVFAGIGFAIPIDRAKEILDDLIKRGKVIRGWLGVEIKEVDEAIKKQFDLPETAGVLLNNVLPDSPAEKYGLKRGDIIIKFDNKKISTPAELQQVVSTSNPKQKVVVEIWRDGKRQNIDIVLGEMPSEDKISENKLSEENGSNEEHSKQLDWLGMSVVTMTKGLAEQYDLPMNKSGVLVIDMAPGGIAHEIGIQIGDLIQTINKIKIENVKEFETITKKIKLNDGIVLDINRHGKPLYISYLGE